MLRRIEHMQLTMTNLFFIQLTLTDLGTSQLAKECRVIKWYWRRLALDIWIYRKEYNQQLLRHMQGAFQRMTTCNLYCKHQAWFFFSRQMWCQQHNFLQKSLTTLFKHHECRFAWRHFRVENSLKLGHSHTAKWTLS